MKTNEIEPKYEPALARKLYDICEQHIGLDPPSQAAAAAAASSLLAAAMIWFRYVAAQAGDAALGQMAFTKVAERAYAEVNTKDSFERWQDEKP